MSAWVSASARPAGPAASVPHRCTSLPKQLLPEEPTTTSWVPLHLRAFAVELAGLRNAIGVSVELTLAGMRLVTLGANAPCRLLLA